MKKRVSLLPGGVVAVLAFALVGVAPAQLTLDFENNATPESINASGAGVPLAGQPAGNPVANQFFSPAGSTAFNAFTYAGNVLGIPANSTGGAQFVSGSASAAGPARGQRDGVTYPLTGIVRVSVDVCFNYQGILPTAQNLASLSLATYGAPPASTNRTAILLFTWNDINTATGWGLNMVGTNAANSAAVQVAITDPAFQNLPVNTWHRVEWELDFTTNQVLAIRVKPVGATCWSGAVSFAPGSLFLNGGATPAGTPAGFRFFSGGAVGNTSAWDNFDLALTGTAADWQVNGNSSLTIDGVTASAGAKALTSSCTNSTATFAVNGTPGSLWEAAINYSATLPGCATGLVLPDGQIININPADITTFFLNGGPNFLPSPFFGGFTANANTGPVPATVSAQQVHIDGTMPLGFALSQACQLDIATPGPVAGPNGDDSVVSVSLSAPPICRPGATIPFYGTSYSIMHVSSNGRVTFGAADIGFAANVTAALTGPPFVGFWGDLDASIGGANIAITSPTATTFRVQYTGVPHFGVAAANTYGIEFDTSGVVTMDGLGGLAGHTALMMLGISAGNTGATNGGQTAFNSAGGPAAGPNPGTLGMIYTLNSATNIVNALATNTVGSITFTPNAGNYLWDAAP